MQQFDVKKMPELASLFAQSQRMRELDRELIEAVFGRNQRIWREVNTELDAREPVSPRRENEEDVEDELVFKEIMTKALGDEILSDAVAPNGAAKIDEHCSIMWRDVCRELGIPVRTFLSFFKGPIPAEIVQQLSGTTLEKYHSVDFEGRQHLLVGLAVEPQIFYLGQTIHEIHGASLAPVEYFKL